MLATVGNVCSVCLQNVSAEMKEDNSMEVNNGCSYDSINVISMDVTEERGMQSFSLLRHPDRHPLTNDMQTHGVKI